MPFLRMVVLCLSPQHAAAPAAGSVRGTVRDQTGAVLQGARGELDADGKPYKK
jgi:hypothetical protein